MDVGALAGPGLYRTLLAAYCSIQARPVQSAYTVNMGDFLLDRMGDHPIMHEFESLDKSGELVIGVVGYFATAIDSRGPGGADVEGEKGLKWFVEWLFTKAMRHE